MKDDQLERSIDDSPDFVIKYKRSCENKSARDSKIDFSELLSSLRKDDGSFPKTVEKPPESPSTSGSINTAVNVTSRCDLDSGDEELVNILYDLHISQWVSAEKSPKSVNERLKWYFCSKTVFNISRKVLTETEIWVLEKGLGFAPTPTGINESDLKRDFNKFSRKMRCKWYFRNQPTENVSEKSAFDVKRNWNPSNGHPALEIFLSKLENEGFFVLPSTPRDYNLSKEEWLAMRGLAEHRNIIIKPADKGSCVALWDGEDYLAEAEEQLQDIDIYEDTDFKESDLVKLVEKSNTMFQSLRRKNLIAEKELKYFSYQYQRSTKFGKMYPLPKIHKRLDNVPAGPVISNCETPTERASEFLDHHSQHIMKSGVPYIKDTNDFLFRLKNLGKIPENAFLVTADVVGLYLSIPHDESLEV